VNNTRKIFNLGDIVQFIPENFDFPQWNYRLIGIGYIEKIEKIKDFNGSMQQQNLYHVYCGKVEKQQMKNFAQLSLQNKTFTIIESEMQRICEVISGKNK
jgi:hypothetical protein